MPGPWDAPPTEDEIKGSVWEAPPTPEEAGAPAASPPPEKTGVGEALMRGAGRGAWAVPGLLGLDQAKAQALYRFVADRLSGEEGVVAPRSLAEYEAAQRGAEQRAERDRPIVTGIGIGAGSLPASALATAAVPAAAGAAGASLGGRALASGLTSGAQAAGIEAGVTQGQPLEERIKRMLAAFGMGGALGTLAPGVGPGLSRAERALASPPAPAPDRIAQMAADRALKATGATKADLAKVRDPEAVGRALLDEPGVSLRSPKAIVETVQPARGAYGREIGKAVEGADVAPRAVTEAGEVSRVFDLASVVQRARDQVLAKLQADPLQKTTADRVGQYLADLESKGPSVPAAEGHAIRKQLDNFLRGATRAQDPESTFAKAALNDVRGIVDDELGATMERAGQGGAWADANAGFSSLSDALKLARRGVARREGNRSFGFAEQVAGGPGAIVGTLAGGIPGGAAGYVGASLAANLVKRYGNPVAARSLDRLAKVLAATPEMLGEFAAPLRAIQARAGPEGLAAAHYMLSRSNPDYAARFVTAAGDEEAP